MNKLATSKDQGPVVAVGSKPYVTKKRYHQELIRRYMKDHPYRPGSPEMHIEDIGASGLSPEGRRAQAATYLRKQKESIPLGGHYSAKEGQKVAMMNKLATKSAGISLGAPDFSGPFHSHTREERIGGRLYNPSSSDSTGSNDVIGINRLIGRALLNGNVRSAEPSNPFAGAQARSIVNGNALASPSNPFAGAIARVMARRNSAPVVNPNVTERKRELGQSQLNGNPFTALRKALSAAVPEPTVARPAPAHSIDSYLAKRRATTAHNASTPVQRAAGIRSLYSPK